MRPPLHILGLALALVACAESQVPSAAESAADTASDTAAPDVVFESAEVCAECHPAHYAEWRESMHAYATRSPAFDAMAAKAYRDTAGEIDTFCTRCHSIPGALQGDRGDTPWAGRSAIGREGITCTTCHTAVGHGTPLGNANIEHDPGGAYLGPYADADSMDHDTTQSAFVTSSKLCGSCHDVFMYPGLQIEQAFTEYLESPAAAAGLRCQDCHMSEEPGAVSARPIEPIAIVGGVAYPARERSIHRFVGPDYALVDDWPYGDDLEANAAAHAANLGRIQTLLENGVRLDALSGTVSGQGWVTVSLVVESILDGHRVPTGFSSERQLWVDIKVHDADGELVYESGDLDANGDLRDMHSWLVASGDVELDADLQNFQSINRTFQRRYGDQGEFNGGEPVIGEAVFPFEATTIVRRSIEPRERRELTYTFDKRAARLPLQATVALKYRNLPPYVLRALQFDEGVERLQIFTIDEKTAAVQ